MQNKMTPELRERLLGSLPFDREASFKFTPEKFISAEIPEEFCPVYKLKSLDNCDVKDATDLVRNGFSMRDEEGKLTHHEYSLKLDFYLEKYITGWELYDLGTDTKKPFNKEEIKYIPFDQKNNIFDQICIISGMYQNDITGKKEAKIIEVDEMFRFINYCNDLKKSIDKNSLDDYYEYLDDDLNEEGLS